MAEEPPTVAEVWLPPVPVFDEAVPLPPVAVPLLNDEPPCPVAVAGLPPVSALVCVPPELQPTIESSTPTNGPTQREDEFMSRH
jgi:hypothetical protein